MALKNSFLRSLPLLLLAGSLTATLPKAHGQDVGSSVVTAALGVPANSGSGNSPAVYLTWWPTGNAQWTPGRYAIYSKPGEPDAPGKFTFVGIVQPQTDPMSVGFSLARSERVGQDLEALSNNIDSLYDKLVPTGGMALAEKLAAIIDVSYIDPEAAETLSLLTRRHPAAAMAAGVAFLDSIPTNQVRTYEIRSCPEGTDPKECVTVSGRVVVTGGEVHYLPAPGQPVHVPFVDDDNNPDPRGNLNLPLRWATPDSLRERSFFQFGYDVYRVDLSLATSKNWHNSQPNRNDFLQTLKNNPQDVQRINSLPILTDKLFNTSQAANLGADPKTFFILDDNGRYEVNGVRFEDGDTFYYFVAGRDLLDRPGQISDGTPITVCFRLPPQAPSGLKVSNHYTWEEATDTQQQVLKLNWEAAKPRDDGPEIAGYWIYRWESIEEMQQKQGLPFSGLPSGKLTGGRIAMVSAQTLEYIDNVGPHPALTYNRGGDLDAPADPQQDHGNKTYWYSVRAIDSATCSANISGNSAPAFGVLRDRIGPEAPGGMVATNCAELFLEQIGESTPGVGFPLFDPSQTYIVNEITRNSSDIAWVEFYLYPMSDERFFLGRFYFSENEKDNNLTVPLVIRNDWILDLDLQQPKLVARVGTADERVSEAIEIPFTVTPDMDPKSKYFSQVFDYTASIDYDSDCQIHEIGSPEELNGQVNPVEVIITLSPKSEEWKLYRRVNDGPLTLLKQGVQSYNPGNPFVRFDDYDLPLNGGRICYYVQVFDQHGNPSIMRRLDCITSQPRTPLSQPMLSAIQPVGEDPSDAGARIRWFSSPEGIERFQIAVRGIGGEGPENISPDLRPDYMSVLALYNIIYVDSDSDAWYRSYLTGRVGANLGAGPDFSIDWTENLAAGSQYSVRVRAIGPGGAKSPWSNEEQFTWSPDIDFSAPFDYDDCVVPWPVRGMPKVSGVFPIPDTDDGIERGLKAEFAPSNPDSKGGGVAYTGGAVRVGLIYLEDLDVTPPTNWDTLGKHSQNGLFLLPPKKFGESSTLAEAFYHQKDGTPLLNFMLYRYQLPSELWPNVSGDVYQVSPLIDRIANKQTQYQEQTVRAVQDPYFFLIPVSEGNYYRAYHLYLKDTQPVALGATYRYLVVRFDKSGEIGQVIPLSPISIITN